MKWEILDKSKIVDVEDLISIILKNRGLKNKKEINNFLNPKRPIDIKIEDLGIPKESVDKVLKRLKVAKEKKERVVIFGDYDADGVCATAILWETLYKQGFDALPYIPDRFDEGYGIKKESFENEKILKLKPELIITVDNGIVAFDALNKAKELGIDVVVVDHHTKADDIKGNPKELNTEFILHSTLVCGSALSWFLSKELGDEQGLDLVALGTVADQMPLVGINRSLVKFGIEEINRTKRIGLKELVKSAGISTVGIYEIGFILAPRINAMGRLGDSIDSLRLLCTKDKNKSQTLSNVLNETNLKRQKIVEDVLVRTLKELNEENKIVVVSGDYHEGVIGLASGRVTEKLYKPSIVISRGLKISKASARSIPGFNIIEAIKNTGLIIEGGGHPMAAGFSIETENIEVFTEKINNDSGSFLTEDLLSKKIKIDAIIDFDLINQTIIDAIKQLEPFGNGNYSPIFVSKDVEIIESKKVGNDGKHLKLKLSQNKILIDAIWFNAKKDFVISNTVKAKIAFTVEENTWNGRTDIQINIKDLFFL